MFRGIDYLETGDRIVFTASLKDSAGAKVITGTTNLRLFRLLNTGALESYDFNDNTFKTGALTTDVLALTHRQGNNNTYNTGIWSAALTTLTGFVAGDLCLAQTTNTNAFPESQERKFQFGGSILTDLGMDRAKDAFITGEVDTGSSNTVIIPTNLSQTITVADQVKGRILMFPRNTPSPSLRGQGTLITANNSSGHLTVVALTTTPSVGDFFVIL